MYFQQLAILSAADEEGVAISSTKNASFAPSAPSAEQLISTSSAAITKGIVPSDEAEAVKEGKATTSTEKAEDYISSIDSKVRRMKQGMLEADELRNCVSQYSSSY